MAKSKALTPFEQKRQELLGEMTAATKEVALDFDKKINQASHGLVMIRFDMGARLAKVIEGEAKYGSNAVEQLAAFLNFPGGATSLYALRNFATEFDRNFVKAQSSQPMLNGRPIEVGHFLQVMKVKSKKEHQKLFDKIRTECLSVNQLEEEIRASYEPKNKRSGGRKPQKPKSPAAGLQKAFSLSQQLANFGSVLSESVFEPIDHFGVDEVDAKLLEKLDLTIQQFEQTDKVIDDGLGHLRKNKERVEKLLADKPPAEASAPKKKATKKKAAKASTKKKTPKSSTKKAPAKKKTAKRKRPAAV